MVDLTYENEGLMADIVAVLVRYRGPGERVIWRQPFRWHDANGVLSNCYESHSLREVCNYRRWAVVHEFFHAAIVRDMTAEERAAIEREEARYA